MSKITFKNFKKRNYDTKSISNYKLCGKCVKCNKNFSYSCVKKFMRNRINKTEKKRLWQSCSKCWLIINTRDDNNWIRKNSAAQKIAQNKPEQLKKNREGVRKSWDTKRREQASKTLMEKWKNDEAFAEKALSNLVRNGDNVKIGFGKGGLKGLYEDIRYDSGLELSFIIWCIKNNIKIKRYDNNPIEYLDENGIHRKYYPDFIINENDIVEIKGSGLWYRKNYNRNILKSTAAKKIFDSYIVLFDKDEAVRTYYRTARKIHNETYKKEND